MTKKKPGNALIKGLLTLLIFLIILLAILFYAYFRSINKSDGAGGSDNKVIENVNSEDASAEAEDAYAEADNDPEQSGQNDDKTDSSKETPSPKDNLDEELSEEDEIDWYIENMSLHEKVCQMFICTPEGLTGFWSVTQAGDTTRSCLEEYPVGGLIYFAQNLESVSQTKEMISATQQFSKEISGLPLFIAVDEEGGTVARCADTLGTTSFSPMFNYKDEGEDTAYENAFTIAKDISELGFNLDFAPVADTWSNSANTVIGRRAYSDDFEETAELIASAVKGFNDGGVCCTLKHFPGHGDTAEDSHYGSAYSSKTLDQLKNEEYLAFKSGISAGADMVMMGHITMTNVDGLPASVSPTMITDELRGRLGFDGVVITDSLAMGATANNYSSSELAVMIVKAGGDMLLMPNDLAEAVSGLEQAVNNGEISEERINESVRRILKLKADKIGLE